MDAVQLLTALASRAGDRIDLIAADQRVRARVLAPSRTTALATVTDAMATLEAELTETDWRLLAAPRCWRTRAVAAWWWLLTDLNFAVDLLPELRALTARHELLVGAVADPRLAELAAGRGDASSVYAAAAASRALGAAGRCWPPQLTRLGRHRRGRAAGPARASPGRRIPVRTLNGAQASAWWPATLDVAVRPRDNSSGASSMSPVRPAATARRPRTST